MIDKYIARPFRWLLHKNVSYWHKGLFQFEYSHGHYHLLAAEEAKPGRVVVVSRAHYQEFLNHYPVSRVSELKQVLKTEFQDSKYVLHYIGPLEQQQRAVCSVVMSEETMRHFDRNCVLVPESILLWQAQALEKTAKQKKSYEVNAFAGYFLYAGDDVPVSQRKSSFCPDYSSFRLNNGVSDRVSCELVPDTQYADRLVSAMRKVLPCFSKVALLKGTDMAIHAFPLRAMALVAGGVSLLYVLMVAGYYQLALNERQVQMSQLGAEINQLMSQQKQLQVTSEEADILSQKRADKLYSAHIWQLVIQMIEIDPSLQVQNISTKDGRIVVRGQAGQATNVLAKLQASDMVDDARFESSIRRQRDKDVFVISIAMAQQTKAQTAASFVSLETIAAVNQLGGADAAQ